ncbi:MAG: trimethylamine methyltransferase family protein [Anaerolineales bacterium]|nr:MAG: trimethylamine methyltransferase family protein [Anaerolineales bacterium]
MPGLEPIRPQLKLEVLNPDELASIKAATLHVLEQVGIHVPSERALRVFAERGAQVDRESQIVRLPPGLVMDAMNLAPRSYQLCGRAAGTELALDGTASYFCTDGCGVYALDFETGQQRASCKDDVAKMARVSDYLSSIAFYWPMVSAQDHAWTAPLHELDASFNNTVKHVQTETVMGEKAARYAVRMAEVIAGDAADMRARPPLSSLICTIAPLGQDRQGIEAGMVFAEAGIPVGFMSMPNMGLTAPVATGGALAAASAEVVSAMVLMQLVAPGAPTFYSIVASVMDPHSANYINAIAEKYLCHVAGVQIAHDWGVPVLGGAFGAQNLEAATWQHGRDSVYNSLMVPLAGADIVVGLGLLRASTLLVPEQIIFDDEIYHTCRILARGIDTSDDGLALDVIAEVGPRGHYLAQRNTRQHLRSWWFPELSHPQRPMHESAPPDIRRRARAKLDKILREHQTQPLDDAATAELQAILEAAERELDA